MVKLDSIAIEPGSITSQADFEYNEQSQSIRVSTEKDSAEICYRVLTPLLTGEIKGRDLSTYDDSIQKPAFSSSSLPIEKEELFDFEGILCLRRY